MKPITLYIFLLINSLLMGQSTIERDTLKANKSIVLNGITYTALPTTGGQVFLETVPGRNFGVKLQNAINALPAAGGIINCQGVTGAQAMSTSVNITKPVRILLGQMVLTFSNAANQNMFNIQSSGVDIIGLGRSANKSDNTGKTKLVMSNDAGEGLLGYHFYNRGNNSITIKDLDLIGKQSTIGRQYGSEDYPLNGAGGVYMERNDPDTREDNAHAGSGNVLNINIENVYIEGTKAHGIYFDTPVLCSIQNVRVSKAGGHGIFIWGGTSCNINSVYVSSANYAGVVLWALTYATVLNSVSEYCGIGWWFRAVKSVSVFNSGVEQTYNLGTNPWILHGTSSYGLKLTTTTGSGQEFTINDVNSDCASEFIGHSYLIYGGEGLSLFSPYGTDPGNIRDYDNDNDAVLSGETVNTHKTRYIKVLAGNRSSAICNPSFRFTSNTHSHFKNDIQIASDVSGLKLEWDPNLCTVDRANDNVYVSKDDITIAPIRDKSDNTLIISGRTFYTAPINKYEDDE